MHTDGAASSEAHAALRSGMSSRFRSHATNPSIARLTNLVGAWSLAVADRLVLATTRAAGRGGQAPAALVALHEFAAGSTIDDLRKVLGISHSTAVRLIDGLVADGHVVRGRDSDDRRSVALKLTPAGRRTARRILAARQEALQSTLKGLSAQQRRSLITLAEVLTAELVDLKLDERASGNGPPSGWLCRLCDFGACGRRQGLCPAAQHARARATPQKH
jgi:MarR family transcriptional regulator, negative regulator of the multidrug operon emrRAB